MPANHDEELPLAVVQCCPLVMPGFEMFTDTCPQLAVLSNSVKLPRASTFIFSGNATLLAEIGQYIE